MRELPLGARRLLLLAGVAGALLVPQAANATINSALGIPCTVQSGAGNVRFCGSTSPRSTAPAFDGVPIDVNIAFPPVPASGPDGNFPLIMLFHGYGGQKLGLSDMHHWLHMGYATFSMTNRGFHESCGSAASKTAAGTACDNGYIRLIDDRYEVRDAQEFAGQLADENLINPQEIGALGGSYGGGMSMALGALKDRKMLTDYSLVPWQSPDGKPMRIAAAAPSIPWTDLAYSLQPNGGTLDYLADAPYKGPVGVEKQSFVGGLYVTGLLAPGFYAPPGTDPTADITSWRTQLEAGEPYGASAKAILDEVTQHHSSYYIDHSEPPAPMLMSSGFTDDLFPADETIRYYNRTKTQYPKANLGLFFGDFGHMRAQNKPDVTNALGNREDHWMNYWVKGVGPKPAEGATAYTLTCPDTAASGGPYAAKDWAHMAPGEIRFDSAKAKTITPGSGSTTVAGAFNPVGGPGACATAAGADQTGTATYRLPAAPSAGYTMMGAATVIANFAVSNANSEVAARLLDVAPDGTETLVDRGIWRLPKGSARRVFQLHPDGWKFASGHVPKLELLPQDTNPGPTGGYARASNDQQPVTVKSLELRIPVVEKPGALSGLIKQPAPKVLPKGDKLAAEFKALPDVRPKLGGNHLTVKGSKLLGNILCPAKFDSCHDVKVVVTSKKLAKKPARVTFITASGKLARIANGTVKTAELKLTKLAKAYFAKHSSLKVFVKVGSSEVAAPAVQKAVARK